MLRFLPSALPLVLSLILLLYPPALQGAQTPVAKKPPPQTATTSATKPVPKTTATTPAGTKTKITQTNQEPVKTPVTAQSKSKHHQVSTPPPQTTAVATTRPRLPRIDKNPPPVAAPADVKPTTTGKKGKVRPAAVALTDALPEMDKQISSKSAIVLDAQTGEELFAKQPDNPRQPASTIKIVTAMIALKSLQRADGIDVSNHAAGMPCSKVFLETNKQYKANDLINAVLLSSANDASVALAEKIAGSEDNFANLMTLSARMWGARNTVCRTASGLTAPGQQSTARDLATLFRYAMQHEDFANRMQEKFITTSYGKVLRNHNKALWRLDGAVGGKTGYTVAARQTYVGQFSRNHRTIVVAIMGSETMWADLEKLVTYGFRKKEEQLARFGADGASGRVTRVN